MSTPTEELIELCQVLPDEKRLQVVNFARFLLASEDDERWERLIEDPRRRPRLEAFLRDAASEGDEPLDLERL